MKNVPKIFLLAFLYAGFGFLALNLAVPPGYASPIWPSAGIALAFVLVYGYRIWPGVFLGSFIVNIAAGINATGFPDIFTPICLSAGIAAGASFQSVFAAYLINKFIKPPVVLQNMPHIMRYFLYGGVLACFVNSSVGVFFLLSFNMVSTEAWWVNLTTWYVGDLMGVFLFGPLALAWIGQPRENWRERKYTLMAWLVIMFVIIIMIFSIGSRWEKERVEQDFQNQITVFTKSLDYRVIEIQVLLNSVKSFFDSSDFVSREEFRTFLRGVKDQLPNIKSIAWTPKVRRSEVSELKKLAVNEGLTDFQIQDVNDEGLLRPASEREVYYPIFYIEPFEENQIVIGVDNSSEPGRWKTLQMARDTGQAQASAPLILGQDQGSKYKSVLISQPVYKTSVSTVEERRANLEGFLTVTMRIKDLISSAADLTPYPENIFLTIFVSDGNVEQPVYQSPDFDPRLVSNIFQQSISVKVAGQEWRLYFQPTISFIAQQQTWALWMLLIVILIITSLLSALILFITGQTFEVRNLVNIRTRELQESKNLLEQQITAKEKTNEAMARQAEKMRQQQQAIINVLEDVETSRKEAEEAETQIKLIIESAPHGMIMVGPEGKIVMVNKEIELCFGYNRGELFGRQIQKLIPQYRLEIPAKEGTGDLHSRKQEGRGEEYELLGRRKDGSEIFVEIGLSPLTIKGEPHVLATVLDVTERKEAENLLRESQERLNLAVQGGGTGIWDWPDTQAKEQWWSDQFYHLIGYTPEEMEATIENFRKLLHFEDRKRTFKAVDDAIKGGESFSVMYRLNVKDKGYRWFRAQADVFHEKQRVRLTGSIVDVHELEMAKQELQRSNQELEQFAYVASHDLQEPVRKIVGFAHLFEKKFEGKMDEEANKYMFYMTDGAKRMQRLIQDLLQYSRVGTSDWSLSHIDMNQILEEVKANLELLMNENQARIIYNDLPSVYANENFMVRLLQNLITNAIKYRSDQPPVIRVEWEKVGGNIEFSVIDNGLGIQPEFAQKIFVIFQRLHTADKYSGTGIGLAVCKRIVERHDGEIRVVPNPDGGSIFKFTIPDRN